MWARFDAFFTAVVMVNAVVIGLQAQEPPLVPGAPASPLDEIDDWFLGMFAFEYLFRLCTHPINTIFSGWCWLDFTVVVIGVVPKGLAMSTGSATDDRLQSASVLRVMRVLKLLRL